MPKFFPYNIPDHEEPSFKNFAAAVFWKTSGLLTGGVIGVGFLVAQFGGWTIAPFTGIIIATIAVFVATYILWRSERSSRLEVGGRYKELSEQLQDVQRDRRPRLVGFLQDVTMYDWLENVTLASKPPRHLGLKVWVSIAFVNDTQVPTTIHGFAIRIKVGEVEMKRDHPEPAHLISSDGLTLTRGADEYVQLESIIGDTEKAAVIGNRIEGVLEFNIPDIHLEQLGDEMEEITVLIADAWGDTHSIVQWGPRPHRPGRHYPIQNAG